MLEFIYSHTAPASTQNVAPQPSILSEYIFFPFYDTIVKYYPKCWAPNKVTLAGVSMTLTSTLLLLSSMPLETQFSPPRVGLLPASLTSDDSSFSNHTPLSISNARPYFSSLTPTSQLILCGFLNLLYCIADNTDGRLARRDQKTSVIGEYLDHGLDCVTSLLSTCCVFLVLGCSLSNMAISVCLIAIATALSHTLNYEKNIFIFGNRILSVDEAMVFFGLSMWLPLLFPSLINEQISNGLASKTCFGFDACTSVVSRLKWIEMLYILYNITQVETFFSLVRRNWQMLFRGHTISIVLNSIVFLSLVSKHSADIATDPRSAIPGYVLAPFSYPAIWIITCACTSSIIVHIPIAAKCARLSRTNLVPLIGLLFVWIIFTYCPSAGAVLSIVLHVLQVLLILRLIKARSYLKAKSNKNAHPGTLYTKINGKCHG
ncbi:unnamed protein product [Phytomonas sp. EM1]|nr:unnamed protein product [Phytomonas sp. EM1]|eukprot:CCW61255.1 unnamed protein product [Phytomonas sp. isolate EM1]